MPRPGPRPYECVRRAWHSDRHQPMRGSLIQEIFRVVNEIHSSATRKNKEWQDKLPIVVLKAEEIMYSKANSEAEYMDLKTLWNRANDAINTIIRLDETTETEVFLQPCIEAALNLGCTPVRTSRSQRNNTTYYLNTKNTNPAICPSKNTTQETPMTFVSHYPQITKPCLSLFNPKSQLPNDKPLKNNFHFPSPPLTKPPAVYPLYYGNVKDTYCESGVIQKAVPKTSVCEQQLREHECDLSLRIGPTPSQPYEMGESENSKRCNLDFDVEARTRKRKAAVLVNGFCWLPKVCSKLENPGL